MFEISFEEVIAQYKLAIGELFNQNMILKAQLKKAMEELAQAKESEGKQ